MIVPTSRWSSVCRSMRAATPTVLAALLLMAIGPACDAKETYDDFDSEATCQDYCAKHFDCAEQNPSSDDTSVCVTACRDSIEDNCGNDDQAAANDKIGTCVDMACEDFDACMTYDSAPECFGFVDG